MSILDHLDASLRPDDGIPEYKMSCCMKYTVDEPCRRCPFRQIQDPEKMEEAMNSCREKRRGDYIYHDEDSGEDVTIEYNNQYI